MYVSKEANVVCSLCEKTFSDANSAKDHERQVHKEENHETKLWDICSEY